jgi:site-specific DNA-methyltransferase (adenine-specific)
MLELNKIYCMDNIQGIAKLGPNMVDLTVTSPPYDNLRKYEGFSFDFEHLAKGLYWVTKPGGVVVWVVGDSTIKGSETGTSFKQALYFKDAGFNLHDTMIYAKENPIPLTHNRYEQQFEYMFVFSKGKPKTFIPLKQPCKTAGSVNNHKSEKHYEDAHSMRKREGDVEVQAEKYLYNIWFLPSGTGDKTKHNAPFPEELVRRHVVTWTNPGDLILDPFMGSGTTGKVALLNNRKYVGFDLSKEYCDEAEQRIAKYA